MVAQDLATQWIRKITRYGKELTEVSSWSRKRSQKVIYTDNSLEFGKTCEELSWHHETSTPTRSETKGIPERAVRRIKEGTSAVLLQSGLDEKWWADSMECCCFLRNVQDLLSPNFCKREFGKETFRKTWGRQKSMLDAKEVITGSENIHLDTRTP